MTHAYSRSHTHSLPLHLHSFWEIICKTVIPMLWDCRLSCLCAMSCPICLSVTLVYCGQTVGWIKMNLGMEVGLGPVHIVLDGVPAPPQKRGTAPAPQFSAQVCYGQTAGWIKMPLGMKVGLGPGDIVLDGDPAPPPPKKCSSPAPSPLATFQWMCVVAK